MKLHPASLGQEETSNSSMSRWSQSDCHCWEVPFGKCASVQLMLFVVCVCHFLTKGARVERGEKKPQNPRLTTGMGKQAAIQGKKQMTFFGLAQNQILPAVCIVLVVTQRPGLREKESSLCPLHFYKPQNLYCQTLPEQFNKQGECLNVFWNLKTTHH